MKLTWQFLAGYSIAQILTCICKWAWQMMNVCMCVFGMI